MNPRLPEPQSGALATELHPPQAGAPEGIRTPDPRLRRPMLCPTELQAHIRRAFMLPRQGQIPADECKYYHSGAGLSTGIRRILAGARRCQNTNQRADQNAHQNTGQAHTERTTKCRSSPHQNTLQSAAQAHIRAPIKSQAKPTSERPSNRRPSPHHYANQSPPTSYGFHPIFQTPTTSPAACRCPAPRPAFPCQGLSNHVQSIKVVH